MIDIDTSFEQKAKIRVIGVGGGGNNAVDRMISDNIDGVEFIIANTDAQVLKRSVVETRIQLGAKLTGGLGAGGNPEIGKRAAEESKDEITQAIAGANMLFVTAGMGGGTGTGAAPVIAEISKGLGVLTVGVVTKPFLHERRMKKAMAGIDELRKHVDTLVVIPNQKLIDVVEEEEPYEESLRRVDGILTQAVQGISDLISNPGIVNVDFADVKAVMLEQGIAHMGIGHGKGKNRAEVAIESAINSPLLETSINGAMNVLVNIAGASLTLKDVTLVSETIGKYIDPDIEIVVGTSVKEELDDEIVVTLIATGIDMDEHTAQKRDSSQASERVEVGARSAHSRARLEVAATSANAYAPRYADDRGQVLPDIKEGINDEPDIDLPVFLKNRNRKR